MKALIEFHWILLAVTTVVVQHCVVGKGQEQQEQHNDSLPMLLSSSTLEKKNIPATKRPLQQQEQRPGQEQQQQPKIMQKKEHSKKEENKTKPEQPVASTSTSTSANTSTTTRLRAIGGSSILNVNALEHEPPPPAHTDRKIVLVTGAAGFVGSHVSQLLLARGDRVIVLDDVNDYYNVSLKESNLQLLREQGRHEDNVVIYRGDICNATLVQSIFETERPTWVVHLAARAGVRPSILDPFVCIHSNIKGTTRLLEFAIRYQVVNFVMASSSSVYGGSKSTLFDEQENVDFPISPYAASKRVTELLGTYYHSTFGLPITSLRFFTVYGPRGRPDMAPFKFIDWTAQGKPIQQFGNGSSSRDYTYIDDIVAGVVGALDRPSPIYQNINLGKGSGTSLSEFVELVAKYVGKQPDIKVLPDQPGDVPYTCANVTRAHVMLDYTPTIPFETGIAKTVEWYKQVYPYSVTDNQNNKKKNNKKKKNRSNNNKMEQNKNDPKTQSDHNGTSGNNVNHNKKKTDGMSDMKKQEVDDKNKSDDKQVQEQRRNRQLQEQVGAGHHRHQRRFQVLPPNEEQKKVLVVAQQQSTLLTKQVIKALTERGDSVALIVPSSSMRHALEPSKYIPPLDAEDKVSIHFGCIDNATFLEHVLEHEQPLWVCYLNSLSNATDSKQDPYTYIDVNIQSFVRFLEVMRKRRDVLNFVFTSSTRAYEPTLVWHAEDETVGTMESPYAVTQKARELFAHTWHSLYRIPMTALRIPQIYGPGECTWCVNDNKKDADKDGRSAAPQDAAKPVAVGQTEHTAATDEEMDQVQEFLFVDDAVDGILRALDRPYPYHIVNLGPGPDLVEEACQSQSSLADMVSAQLEGRFFATSTTRPCALSAVDKARERLGFTAKVRLRNGIRRVADWFWDHPDDLQSLMVWDDKNRKSNSLVKTNNPTNHRNYPPLPWGADGVRIVSDAETTHLSRFPLWSEELVQVQWVIISVFLLWRCISLSRNKRSTEKTRGQ